MKFFITILTLAFVGASEASYLTHDNVLSYQGYGYGLPLASYPVSAVVDKYSYPSSWYGSQPAVKQVAEYSTISPVPTTKIIDNSYGLEYNQLVAPVVTTKVIDRSYDLGYNKLTAPGLANGYGLGYNKLVTPVVATNVIEDGLLNYGGYGLGYNKYLSSSKYVL
uniref:Uncharacterized protein n=1 Tax=Anopheles farauti TaxID=69004 RepID=A0A182QWF7_9DIPT